MMTFVGMPTVFYGDELGIQGILEEEYRHPMPWNGGDTDLRAFFKKAIAMRHELAPLRRGDFRMVSAEAGSGLIVFSRKLGNRKVTVCINHGKGSADLPDIAGSIYWADGLNDKTFKASGFAVFSSCEA
jgi:glycosidase